MDEANKKDKLRKLNVSPPSPARSDRSSTDFNSHCFLLKPVLKPSAFTSYNGHVKQHQGSIETPGSTTRIDPITSLSLSLSLSGCSKQEEEKKSHIVL